MGFAFIIVCAQFGQQLHSDGESAFSACRLLDNPNFSPSLSTTSLSASSPPHFSLSLASPLMNLEIASDQESPLRVNKDDNNNNENSKNKDSGSGS